MMKVVFFLAALVSFSGYAQTAPPHLKYYGYAIIDCNVDDPNDTTAITNYITEIDSFSNLAQLYVSNYTDTIVARVNLMNSLCVQPILSTSEIFYAYADTNAPSGANYDLRTDYLSRWNTFKTNNASVLNANDIGVIYIVDEPTWNGITPAELDTVCSLIKTDFPAIPIMFVEAWPVVGSMYIPTTLDYVGFDHYGIFDVSTDSTYLAELALVKNARSQPGQKIFLVVDDQWHSGYAGMGWTQDTMQYVVQSYYNLAASDTNIIGLAGFTWPGLAPGWLGVRNMTQSMIDKNVQLGMLIKANYNPCTVGMEELQEEQVLVYPNPFSSEIRISGIDGPWCFELYDVHGKKLISALVHEGEAVISGDLAIGFYFYSLRSAAGGYISRGKLVRQ